MTNTINYHYFLVVLERKIVICVVITSQFILKYAVITTYKCKKCYKTTKKSLLDNL